MATLYLDLETEGLDVFRDRVVTVQVLLPSGKIVIIKDPENLDVLKPVLEKNLIVGHNIAFDSKFLKHHFGINLRNVYDTQIAELVISGGLYVGKRDTTRYKDVSLRYCNVEVDKSQQLTFRYGIPLTPEQVEYASNDLIYLPEIMRQQIEKIKLLNLESVINTEMRALPAIVWLELSGIYVDIDKLNSLMLNLEDKKSRSKTDLLKLLNKNENEININSTKQLTIALNNIGIPVENTSKEELAKFSHIAIRTLKDYREANKLLCSFADRISDYIETKTGRVHANFHQIGTNTGRISCTDPNLQQQPSEAMPEYRSIFKAEHGNKIITTDYSQIELRIIAQVSEDQEFINAFKKGEDLHKLTASKIFKVPLEKVDKKQRSIAKTVNFGISYGMSSFGLQRKLQTIGIEITDKEAKNIIKEFYKSYSGMTKYLKNASYLGLKYKEIRNLAGRLIRFRKPRSNKERNGIRRQARNKPIQSLCGDMIKIAMGNLFLILEPMGVKFVNMVHDELVFECREAQAEEVKNIVKAEMEKAGSLFLIDVPCIADPKVSDVWEK